MNECGFKSASLGSSILRVDTAVVACLGIVSAVLDEFRNKRQRSSSSSSENKRVKERKTLDSESLDPATYMLGIICQYKQTTK